MGLDNGKGNLQYNSVGEKVLLHCDRPPLGGGKISGLVMFHGWALAPSGIKEVKIYCEEKLIGLAGYGKYRGDVGIAHPGIKDSSNSGFTMSWDLEASGLPMGEYTIKIMAFSNAGSVGKIQGKVSVISGDRPYDKWLEFYNKDCFERLSLKNCCHKLFYKPTIAMIVQCREKLNELSFRELLNTVIKQTYPFWAMYIDTSDDNRAIIARTLESIFPEVTPKVTFVNAKNKTMSLEQIPEGYITFIEEGDLLQVHALLEMVYQLNVNPNCKLVYVDHDLIAEDGKRCRPFFKPDWSPDLLLSTNYLGHFCLVEKDLCIKAGGLRQKFGKAMYYDLWLRVAEMTGEIAHVPDILCSYKKPGINNELINKELAILSETLQRRKIEGSVINIGIPAKYRVIRKTGTPKVTIVIPTTARLDLIKPCLKSIAKSKYKNYEVLILDNSRGSNPDGREYLSTTNHRIIVVNEPYNWSRLNNLGARAALGEYLIFLNDDTEVITEGWIEAMLEHAQRSEVGVVGPLLLFPDNTVQHGGVLLLGHGGFTAHHFYRYPFNGEEYQNFLRIQRNCIGVTGACLMVGKQKFIELGGFNEGLSISCNDIDFCIRAWKKDFINVWTPYARLYHHELVSRKGIPEEQDENLFSELWGELLKTGDPYFNPNLGYQNGNITLSGMFLQIKNGGQFFIVPEEIKRILVVKLDHIGDVMLSLPALRKIRQNFPAAEITVMVGSWARGLLEGERSIDRVLSYDYLAERSEVYPPKQLSNTEKEKIRHWLTGYNFDLAIDLRKHGETEIFLELSGAPYTVSYSRDLALSKVEIALPWQPDNPREKAKRHMADQLLHLVDAIRPAGEIRLGVSHSKEELVKAREKLFTLVSGKKKLLAGIHPGVGNLTRQWPPEYFAALADKLVNAGATVVFFGGSGDEEIIQSIRGKMRGESFSAAGKLSLREFAAAVVNCHLFIGNNSGPMHIAGQSGIPTLGIFNGEVDPHEWAPLGPNTMIVRKVPDCAPCYLGSQKECNKCLMLLFPEDVWKAVERLLVFNGYRLPRMDKK